MKHQSIPRVMSKRLIPFIMLFAFYVQFHGDFGPGGGFQAGVILAVAFILYALVFGLDEAQKIARPALVERLIALGIVIYAGTGYAGLLQGGDFLNYNVLNHHDPVHGQHYGIMLVELGVGMTVAAVMITIFYMFAGRRRAR